MACFALCPPRPLPHTHKADAEHKLLNSIPQSCGAAPSRCHRAQSAESLLKGVFAAAPPATLPPEPGDPVTLVPNRRHIVIHTLLICHCSGFCFFGGYLEGRFFPSIDCDTVKAHEPTERRSSSDMMSSGQIRKKRKHTADGSMSST